MLVEFHRMLLTHALALSANQFYATKSPYEYVHSVRIEPTKLVLAGTRITYHLATWDAGCTADYYVSAFRQLGVAQEHYRPDIIQFGI